MSEISQIPGGTPGVHTTSSSVFQTDSVSSRAERGSIKVLVADNDPLTVESLTRLFSEWGYDPVAVSSGTAALNLLSGSDGPSLAVLDWTLPDISGTEICRRLRAA